MKLTVGLRNVVAGMVVLTFVFLAGCGGGGGEAKGDPIAVAQQFMDLYYKQGNAQEAKALANAEMAEKIQATAAAATEAAAADQEISYILKEQSREGKHSYALFQMTIKKKEGEPTYKTVSLFVDLVEGAWKITLFDERTESKPHQETTKG